MALDITETEVSIRAWLEATRRPGKGGTRRDLFGVEPMDLLLARALLASCLADLRRFRLSGREPDFKLLLTSKRALFNIATLCGQPQNAFKSAVTLG